MKKKVEEILKNGLSKEARLKSLDKLFGDASYRVYYRAKLSDDETYVIMKMPKGKASASEEITNFKGEMEEIPYINIANYLRGKGLAVPAIHFYSKGYQMILIEDVGDVTFSSMVQGKDASTINNWYTKAIDLLVKLQEVTAADKSKGCIAFKRSFDETLLNWEFDHFREYGIEAGTGKKLRAIDRKLFDETTRAISSRISKERYGFTHRDYQSRNLMIKPDGSLVMLDFQDALLGPPQYDMVALLRDSYVELPTETLMELKSYYCDNKKIDQKDFNYMFDLVTIQRKLKDAGRFVYIDRVKKNPNFLQYIPTSLSYVRSALERQKEFGKFKEMLTRYIPEWQ